MNLLLETCLFILILIIEVVLLFLVSFTRKVSENNADILQNQQKYYQWNHPNTPSIN